jgi:hypothetical protein
MAAVQLGHDGAYGHVTATAQQVTAGGFDLFGRELAVHGWQW